MKKILSIVGVAVLLFLGVSFYAKVPTVPATFGAATSPDISSPYISFGNHPLWANHVTSLIQASSTVCSLQSPAATSTLISAGIQFTLASSSAVIVDLAKSASPAATTTKIGTTYTVGASNQATIVASSTGSVAGDATIFAPNTYFVVKMDGGVGSANNAPIGSCYALWSAF